MKRLALVIVAAPAALGAVQGGAATSGPVLAISGQGSAARLGYVDPVSLKLVGRSTQVGYYAWPSARSPDGSRVALGRNYLTSGLRINGQRLAVVDLASGQVMRTAPATSANILLVG